MAKNGRCGNRLDSVQSERAILLGLAAFPQHAEFHSRHCLPPARSFGKATKKLDESAAAYQEKLPAIPRFIQTMAWHERGDAAKARQLYDLAVAATANQAMNSPGDKQLLDFVHAEAKSTLDPPHCRAFRHSRNLETSRAPGSHRQIVHLLATS